MYQKCCAGDTEIPAGEIRQQLEYARVIGEDLFNLFAVKSEEKPLRECEYSATETKLSMLLDFLFQAKIWCEVLEGSHETCKKVFKEEI